MTNMTTTEPVQIGNDIDAALDRLRELAEALPDYDLCWKYEAKRLRIGQNGPQCAACVKRHVWAEFIARCSDGLRRNQATGLLEIERQNFRLSNPKYEARFPDVYSTAKSWTGSTNVYIHGPAGTGKTFLAHAMLCSAMANRAAQWLDANAPVLSEHIALSENDGDCIAETDAAEFCHRVYQYGRQIVPDWAIKPRVLLFDDICKGDWNTHTVPGLFAMLDGRMRAGRTTIITAQSNISELAEIIKRAVKNEARAGERYANPILDRLAPLTVLEMSGSSLRGLPDRGKIDQVQRMTP